MTPVGRFGELQQGGAIVATSVVVVVVARKGIVSIIAAMKFLTININMEGFPGTAAAAFLLLLLTTTSLTTSLTGTGQQFLVTGIENTKTGFRADAVCPTVDLEVPA